MEKTVLLVCFCELVLNAFSEQYVPVDLTGYKYEPKVNSSKSVHVPEENKKSQWPAVQSIDDSKSQDERTNTSEPNLEIANVKPIVSKRDISSLFLTDGTFRNPFLRRETPQSDSETRSQYNDGKVPADIGTEPEDSLPSTKFIPFNEGSSQRDPAREVIDAYVQDRVFPPTRQNGDDPRRSQHTGQGYPPAETDAFPSIMESGHFNPSQDSMYPPMNQDPREFSRPMRTHDQPDSGTAYYQSQQRFPEVYNPQMSGASFQPQYSPLNAGIQYQPGSSRAQQGMYQNQGVMYNPPQGGVAYQPEGRAYYPPNYDTFQPQSGQYNPAYTGMNYRSTETGYYPSHMNPNYQPQSQAYNPVISNRQYQPQSGQNYPMQGGPSYQPQRSGHYPTNTGTGGSAIFYPQGGMSSPTNREISENYQSSAYQPQSAFYNARDERMFYQDQGSPVDQRQADPLHSQHDGRNYQSPRGIFSSADGTFGATNTQHQRDTRPYFQDSTDDQPQSEGFHSAHQSRGYQASPVNGKTGGVNYQPQTDMHHSSDEGTSYQPESEDYHLTHDERKLQPSRETFFQDDIKTSGSNRQPQTEMRHSIDHVTNYRQPAEAHHSTQDERNLQPSKGTLTLADEPSGTNRQPHTDHSLYEHSAYQPEIRGHQSSTGSFVSTRDSTSINSQSELRGNKRAERVKRTPNLLNGNVEDNTYVAKSENYENERQARSVFSENVRNINNPEDILQSSQTTDGSSQRHTETVNRPVVMSERDMGYNIHRRDTPDPNDQAPRLHSASVNKQNDPASVARGILPSRQSAVLGNEKQNHPDVSGHYYVGNGETFIPQDGLSSSIENEGALYNGICSCVCDYGDDKELLCTWQVVFKAVTGLGYDVYTDFYASGNINPSLTEFTDKLNFERFRNGDILDNWGTLPIREVKVEVFESENRVAWFLFNGISTTLTNWFMADNVIASSYEDLKTGRFSDFVTGLESGHTFAILRSFIDCENDCGYLLILDGQSGFPCDYENITFNPAIFYGKRTDQCSQLGTEFGIADNLVISVKVCDSDA